MGTSDKEIIEFVISRYDKLDEKVFAEFKCVHGRIDKLDVKIDKLQDRVTWIVGVAFGVSTSITTFISIYF